MMSSGFSIPKLLKKVIPRERGQSKEMKSEHFKLHMYMYVHIYSTKENNYSIKKDKDNISIT